MLYKYLLNEMNNIRVYFKKKNKEGVESAVIGEIIPSMEFFLHFSLISVSLFHRNTARKLERAHKICHLPYFAAEAH